MSDSPGAKKAPAVQGSPPTNGTPDLFLLVIPVEAAPLGAPIGKLPGGPLAAFSRLREHRAELLRQLPPPEPLNPSDIN